ncbi:hypothetical protein IFR05_015873 [Cadophora sp. M221]|nr:hypothetical protein IFR05_015873 [Cadophora sp. M221]
MVALHYLSLDDTISDVQVAYQLVDELTPQSMATINYIAAIGNFVQEAEYYLEEEADQPLPLGGGWAPNRGTLLEGWLNEAKNENAPKDSFWRKVFIFADKSVTADVIFGLIRLGRTKSNSNKTVDEELNSWPEVWLHVLVKTVRKKTKVPLRISLGIAALDQIEKKQRTRKKKRKRGDNESLPALQRPGAEPEGENEDLPVAERPGTEALQHGQSPSTNTQSSNQTRKLRIVVEICDQPQPQSQQQQAQAHPYPQSQQPQPQPQSQQPQQQAQAHPYPQSQQPQPQPQSQQPQQQAQAHPYPQSQQPQPQPQSQQPQQQAQAHPYPQPQSQQPQAQAHPQPPNPQQVADWKKRSGYEIFPVTAVELNMAVGKYLGVTRSWCYAEKLGPSSESPVRVDPSGRRAGLFSVFLGQTGKNLAKRAAPAATPKDHEFSLPFSHLCDHVLELVQQGDKFDMEYCQGIAVVCLPPDYFLVLIGQTFTDIKDAIKDARKRQESSL